MRLDGDAPEGGASGARSPARFARGRMRQLSRELWFALAPLRENQEFETVRCAAAQLRINSEKLYGNSLMFKSFSKCQKCGAELIDGPEIDREAQAKRFSCKVKGIPTKICPHGCIGQYWYWLDFGVEVFEALSPTSTNIAKRKLGLFKMRNLCKICNVELVDRHELTSFTFHQKLRKGSDLEISINAPSLSCPKCTTNFIPAQSSNDDTYYIELIEALQDAITRDLIYK